MIASNSVLEADMFSFWAQSGTAWAQILIMIGIFLVLAVVFFAWAAMWRSKPRNKRHSFSSEEGGLPERRRRRSGLSKMLFPRKRHRRKRTTGRERPVNPTLSQVGGLPPRRDEQQPPN